MAGFFTSAILYQDVVTIGSTYQKATSPKGQRYVVEEGARVVGRLFSVLAGCTT